MVALTVLVLVMFGIASVFVLGVFFEKKNVTKNYYYFDMFLVFSILSLMLLLPLAVEGYSLQETTGKWLDGISVLLVYVIFIPFLLGSIRDR